MTVETLRKAKIQVHVHEKLARVMAVVLSFAVFFTGMDLTVLAVQSERQEEETYTITGFAALSEGLADQTVSVGTAVEELNLPEALEAYAMRNQDDSDADSDDDSDDNSDDDSDDDSEKTGDGEDDTVSENDDDEEEPEEGNDDGDSDTETGEGTGESGEEEPEEDGEEEPDNRDGDGVSINSAAFVMPVYYSENTQDEGKVETLVSDVVKITIEDVTWESTPAYDGESEGVYVFTPVLPEGYLLAEGVSLPQITVTVEENISPAWQLLNRLLEDYFAGEKEGLYEAVLSMDKDTRLAMMAAYEDVTAALTEDEAEDEELNAILANIREGFHEAGNRAKYAPTMYEIEGMETTGGTAVRRKAARAAAPNLTAGPIPLEKLDGEGTGFYYTTFRETKRFDTGVTYAFLDDVYDYDDAVANLGSGAVLEITNEENNSVKYAGNSGYADMKFTHIAYVNVITPGEDFDWCKVGGIFKVGANSGTPQEYRYFCGFSGAQNCGPLYAYTYAKKELNYTHVDASLKDITKQGSNSSQDYTVTLTIKGVVTTVSPSSYSVSADQTTGVVTITVKDSEGNRITTRFQGPLAVRYQGNGSGVTKVPALQGFWKGSSVTLSSQKPVRSGYQFEGWRYNSASSATIYQAGAKLTAVQSVSLYAAWKDIQKPVVTVKPLQVMLKTPDEEIKAEIQKRLTITDNEPVEECKVEIVGENFAAKPGIKNITVNVKDKAGNVGACTAVVTVVAMPLEFAAPAFDQNTKALNAVLKEPGAEAITETGFVWGIMTNPSFTLYNGKAKTTQPVTVSNGKVSVTAQNLQKGVTYYARAYAVTGTGGDSIVYYSDQITIGLGLPAYGSFTIKNNNNNTFTVTRSGGSEGVQTVYYRTVNGSAVGGTHFTHQAKTLTFAAGETSSTITIAETGANTAYSGKPATAYTNADRTYSVEIYRVTGGGKLGSTSSAIRTMNKDSGYTISRDVYDKEKERSVSTDNDNRYVVDRKRSQDNQIVFSNDRGYNMSYPDDVGCHKNFNVQRTMPDYGEKVNAYLKATAGGYYYRLRFTAEEVEDAWAHIWIATHVPNTFNSAPQYNGPISLDDSIVGSSKFTARWDITGNPAALTFPGASERSNITGYGENVRSGAVEGDYLVYGLNDEVNVWFGANGSGKDIWRMITYKDWIKVRDVKEPQPVAVAPMAGGLYKAGDTFVVSLIFDEIVDGTNSPSIGSVSVNTNWGVATYTGGVNTNVLYFTGTVKGDASGTLSVQSIANPDYIKDMCNGDTKTQTADKTGNTGASVDTSAPVFNVTSAGITNGVGTAKITVTPDQSKTTSMRYAWSDSTAMPVSGWVNMTAEELTTAKSAGGFFCPIRKEAGSGASDGKWYLHVMGAYDTTGATTYQYAMLDFGTKSSPAAGSTAPELTVSVNNSQWATSRTISIQQKGASSLKYRNAGVQGSPWQNLSIGVTNVTVTENGYYTFLLTAGDTTITRSVTVEKIDRVDPVASVGLPVESGTVESPKAGVYTKLTLPVTYGDEHSGVKKVEYAWTNSSSVPASWNTLSGISAGGGSTSLTYQASETTPVTKYLHIRVTDQLNHSCTEQSVAYRMVSQGTVDNHTPKITLTGAPTKWTNDMATLQWSLTNYAGKNYEVILPNGNNAKNNTSSGQIWARSNGTYTVKVRDLDYGGENAATVQVTKIDTTAPTVTPSSISGDWKKNAQTVTFSASDNSQSGVGKKYYKIVDTKDEIPADGLTQLMADRVNVTKDGVWYVYYKYYDQAGDDSVGREANKTEGFVGPIRIDKVSPTAAVSMGGDQNEESGWYTAAVPATLTFSDPQSAESGSGTPGGVSSVKYRWVNTKTKPTSGLSALTAPQIQTGSYVNTQAGDGTWYLYYQVTDAAGNMTDGFSEEAVKIDKTKAALTVTGPAVSAEKRTGFTLNAQTGSFGVSGGALSVKKGGLLATETTLKSSTSSGVLSAGYSVTEPGTYHFYSRTNADKSDGAAAVQTRYVHQAVFDSRGGSEVEPQLVWTSREAGDSGDGAGSGAGTAAECKVQKPADPEKRGLVFGGWYTDEKCQNAFDFNSQIYEDITLYAKWTADSYDVTYHLTNPDGSAYEAEESYREYTFGEGLTLPVPEQEGYRFGGWYLTADDTGDVQTVIGENEIGAKTYYARYVDITAPQIEAELSAESRESGWYIVEPAINLTYSDNQGVKRLLVSVDGGEWQELSGFPIGSGIKDDTAHKWTYEEVQEGEHTYVFQVMDAAELSGETKPIRVKLDTVKPVLGDITYNEGYATLWDWLIRRDKLLIHIPVTEQGSGLAKVTYTLTPGSMQSAEPVTKEAKIEKTTTDAGTLYTAVIAIDPDYKGVIGEIRATDIAGNVSEPVTAYANGIGVIVEELKPVITVTADRLPTEEQAGTKPEGEALSEKYYQTTPELLVKVQDGSMAASGIKEVKWRVENGDENTENGGFGDVLKTEYGFRIALNGLTGTVQAEISAVDNAGNSESKSVTVKIKGKEQTPEAETDYPAEKLTGLKPGEAYLVCLPGGKKVTRKADENGEISIDNGWFGKEISLIKKGVGKNTKNSDPQNLAFAARPAAPILEKSDETIKGKRDGRVTGVTNVMEISRDGKKTWEKAVGAVTDAASGKLWARVAATRTAPRGEEAFVTIKEGRALTVTFDSQGGSKVKSIKGLSWKEAVKKPADPKKEGDHGFCGWYREASYENRWHFAEDPEADLLTDNVTLWAKWLPKANTPMTAGISYRDETLTKLEPGTVYLIEGKEVAASAEGTVPIDESWFGKKINIVRRGDGINTGNSDALRLNVPKRPAGPAKVEPKPESAQDAKDGKLTKTDTTMQYRRKGSTEWITITDKEIINLEPGDYELRYVSTDTAFSSKIVVKTIKKYGPPKKDDSGSGGSDGGDHGGATPNEETMPDDGTKSGSDTKPGDDKKSDNGTKPSSGTKPGDATKPSDATESGEETKPGDDTTSNDTTKPSDDITPNENTKSGDDGKQGDETEPGDAAKTDDGTKPSEGTTLEHIVSDGRIVSDENPYAVGKSVKTLTIPVNQGAVIVTVNNMDETRCTVQAADAVEVANAVLSQEHISRVSEGETIEIRIDVERIDDRVNSADKDLIEREIEKTQEKMPGLAVGMYVDISMFLRRGEGEWNAVHEIDEPIEIVIDMPEELRELTADFYIVRAHAGEYTLLPDLDDAAETITIETERFSTYAIAYRLTDEKTERCSLCHICPTFLGICYFIWLLLAGAAVLAVIVIFYRRRKDKKGKEE